MTEKLEINNKTIWIDIQSYHVERENSNIIPTEYFMASYFLEEPVTNAAKGTVITDDNNKTKLFESPVAALSYAEKKLEKMV